MADLSAGSVFAGYQIERLVGRGGMGVVYLATQLALKRRVALKVISPELASEALFRERFNAESELAASIDHPNVVPVYEAGDNEGVLFISMRYVDGTDLWTLIAREKRLVPVRAADIVTQVGAALDAAHRRGLVHRDVKPANVLLAANGAEHAYLTDFGLTKRVAVTSGLTRTGEFLGTVDYIAPEQINEERADARSDVYSLGCVLFHALTGQVPFQRETEVAKIYAHLHDPPPEPSEHVPGLPADLDEVVARAMAKDRDERFESAGDLGRAAVAAASGRPLPDQTHGVAIGAAGSTRRAAARATGRPSLPGRARRRAGAPSHSSRRSRLIPIGALAVVAIAGVVLVATGESGGGKTRIDAGSVVESMDAGTGRVILERAAPGGGTLLSEVEDNTISDLPGVDEAADHSGIDVGTDANGKPLLIFSRCDREARCDIWGYRFTRDPVPVSGASQRFCEELGPNIDEGNITFRVKRGASNCRLGLFLLALPNERPRHLIDNTELGEGADLEDGQLAWATAGERPDLRLARLRGNRLVTGKGVNVLGHTFRGPLVLEHPFLYFIDRPERAAGRYFIARKRLGLQGGFGRYREPFETSPTFTVTDGDLYYSENDDVIVRDEQPEFDPGLER